MSVVCIVKQKSRGTWKPWLDFIKGAFAPPPGKKLQEILVPTMDTARYSYLMDLFIRFKKYDNTWPLANLSNSTDLLDLERICKIQSIQLILFNQ